jgi:integrase
MDSTIREAMQHAMTYARYKPARLLRGKETMIIYYAWDPLINSLKRVKEHLNREAKQYPPKEFAAFVKQRIQRINALLAMGWSPFRDGSTRLADKPLKEAVEAFIRSKERERRSKDTMRTYRSLSGLLMRWVEKGPLPLITAAAFDEGMAKAFMNAAYEERRLSEKSFNNSHTFYITLWNWLKEYDYVQRNVFEAVKKKHGQGDESTYRPPSATEREAVRIGWEKLGPRFTAFCLLCFHCAIRPKEAFLLKPGDINLAESCITVHGAVAKNNRTRGVAIPKVLIPYLEALNLAGQRPEHYVFSTRFDPGPRLKDSRYSGKWWVKLRKVTGLDKEVKMYQLKHAGAEQLSRDGVSDVDLMNHLRHKDLKETTIYTKRAYKEGVRTVVEKATAF